MHSKIFLTLFLALILAGCGTLKTYRIDTPPAAGASKQTQKTMTEQLHHISVLLYRYVDTVAPPVPKNRNLYAKPFSMEQIRFADSEFLAAVTGQLAAAACMAQQVWPEEKPEDLFRAALEDQGLTHLASEKKWWNMAAGVSPNGRLAHMKHAVQQIPCERLGDMTVDSFDKIMQSQRDSVRSVVLRSHNAQAWTLYRTEAEKVSRAADFWQNLWAGRTSPQTEDPEDKWASLWQSQLDPGNDVAILILELRGKGK